MASRPRFRPNLPALPDDTPPPLREARMYGCEIRDAGRPRPPDRGRGAAETQRRWIGTGKGHASIRRGGCGSWVAVMRRKRRRRRGVGWWDADAPGVATAAVRRRPFDRADDGAVGIRTGRPYMPHAGGGGAVGSAKRTGPPGA